MAGAIQHRGSQQHLARREFAHRVRNQGGLPRRHRKSQLGNGCAKTRIVGGDTDIAAAGNLHTGTHAIATDLRNDGHIAVQHGLQTAPDIVLVEGTQTFLLKAKCGVFRKYRPRKSAR